MGVSRCLPSSLGDGALNFDLRRKLHRPNYFVLTSSFSRHSDPSGGQPFFLFQGFAGGGPEPMNLMGRGSACPAGVFWAHVLDCIKREGLPSGL